MKPKKSKQEKREAYDMSVLNTLCARCTKNCLAKYRVKECNIFVSKENKKIQ